MNDVNGRAASGEVELTVMIPAYREAESLRTLLPSVKAAAAMLTRAFEVLIVDTEAAMDDTAAICAENGVRHVARSGGNHYGDALRTGIREARGRYMLCMDADGSHNPSYFAAMWAQREQWDVVIGSRYAKGGHTENPAVLIFMSWLVNVTFRVAFGISAKDVTNSFRLYRSEILHGVELRSNSFDVLEELLIKVLLQTPPAQVGEVPVTFERRKAGESKRKLLQFAFGYVDTLRKLRRYERDARAAAQQKKR